jgi:uncharacterized damage-inducible protein DinB
MAATVDELAANTHNREMRLIFGVLASVLSLNAQNPLSDELRKAYADVKNNVLRSAEKMPEENYGFRPAPRVRTFGELLGHVAQEQYLFFCGPVKGEHKAADIEKTKTSKADLVKALQESFGYCDGAYSTMTDAKLADVIDVGGSKHTKSGLLWGNVNHDTGHYGNIVTYLRIKGIVPPSTEGQ